MKKIIIIIGAFVIVGSVVAACLSIMNQNEDVALEDGAYVCTQEALICPDGSAVGRSGEMCNFDPCPNVDFFIGMFVQDEFGSTLVIENEDVMQDGMDSYTIQLDLSVISMMAGEFTEDTVVKVSGEFVEGNVLRVQTIEEFDTDSQTEATLTVGIGETKMFKDLEITLNEVVQDSRCPIDALCIEAGAITANVTFETTLDLETLNMPSDEIPQEFDGYTISIESVSPARVSDSEPDPLEYRVRFSVTEISPEIDTEINVEE